MSATDVDIYTMDWGGLGYLNSGEHINSATIDVNGDVTIADQTNYSGNPTAIKLQITGGIDIGWTGDPLIAQLSVVTVTVVTSAGRTLARSFNVRELPL